MINYRLWIKAVVLSIIGTLVLYGVVFGVVNVGDKIVAKYGTSASVLVFIFLLFVVMFAVLYHEDIVHRTLHKA